MSVTYPQKECPHFQVLDLRLLSKKPYEQAVQLHLSEGSCITLLIGVVRCGCLWWIVKFTAG